MKTFVRLIRRYVLAAVGIVLLLLFSGVAVLGWLGWQESCRLPQREYSSSEIADSMVETAEGLAFGAERTPQEWMNGYEWAMVLDDVGNIRWSYGLPQELNHAYTPGDIAKFARWYLADYPVFCWTEPYGLFVIGLPKGSLWKYSIYSSPDFVLSMVRVLPAAALGMLLLGLVLCFWLSWRGAKRLETVANGLDVLAQGQTVRLPTDGFAGELAEKLNQTGAQLQAKNEMLSRRDNARTQWIAGVSHDVRTPLALILGWAEQLEQDALLPDSSRQKATGIRTQCEKLRTLIDDLNLTSKLEYGAQPLRRKDLRAGPLFRQLVAQFCESPLAEHCGITLEQEEPAEQTVLSVDEALLARLLENLLGIDGKYIAAFVVLAMAGYFAAIVHAPVTGVVLITEMTGDFRSLLGLVMVSLIAFVISERLGTEPIYTQLMNRSSGKRYNVPKQRKSIIDDIVYPGSIMDGKRIMDMGLPLGALIVSVIREEQEFIPDGHTILRGGDVIEVLLREEDLAEVEHIIEEECKKVRL